jgi:hypothetical protein
MWRASSVMLNIRSMIASSFFVCFSTRRGECIAVRSRESTTTVRDKKLLVRLRSAQGSKPSLRAASQPLDVLFYHDDQV